MSAVWILFGICITTCPQITHCQTVVSLSKRGTEDLQKPGTAFRVFGFVTLAFSPRNNWREMHVPGGGRIDYEGRPLTSTP